MAGIGAWLLVGILIAIAIRIVAKAASWVRGLPPITAALVGSMLGGFVHDLMIRGDSVVDLKGPTLIGATIGSMLVLAAAYAVGWTTAGRSPHEYGGLTHRHATCGEAEKGACMTAKDVALERLSDTPLELAKGERDIRNMKALDADGNELGTVTGLYVDAADRTVRFLLVRGGGILGIGDRELLIPVEAIRRVDDAVRLGHSRLQVAQAPAYQPDLVDQRWYWEGMYGWYGYPPFWGGPIGMAPVQPNDRRADDDDDAT